MGRGTRSTETAADVDAASRPRATGPADFIQTTSDLNAAAAVVQRHAPRLTGADASIADAFLDRAFRTYYQRSFDAVLDDRMLAMGAAPADTPALVAEWHRDPSSTMHLRDGEQTRCGRQIDALWTASQRRGAWAQEPDRHCPVCAEFADAEPACSETHAVTLAADERARLQDAARRGLRDAATAEAPVFDNDRPARLLKGAARAVAEQLVEVASRRAAQRPYRAAEAILSADDRIRVERRYGSLQASPAATAEQFAAAQRELVSRRLSSYDDDLVNASRLLADSILQRA